jgi:molybdenum cofactor cytidylyltransferase
MTARINAILLAAGNSRRFGTTNKLLVQIDGLPLIRRVAEEILRSEIPVIVVTGCDRRLIEQALSDLTVCFVHHAHWPNGMGSSISAGVGALRPETEGVIIVPGDMPFLTTAVIRTLIQEFEAGDRISVVFPVTPAGEQRNPVVWPRQFFSQLKSLSGPGGGKALLKTHFSESRAVRLDDEMVLQDVDTPDDMPVSLSAG